MASTAVWYDWVELPGLPTADSFAVQVSAVARDSNNISVFATGSDGQIYSTAWNSSAGWMNNPWALLGGSAQPGSKVTVVARYPTHLDLFVTQADGQIASTFWDASSGWRDGWFTLPRSTAVAGTPVAAVARTPNNLDLFMVGGDNQVWSTFWNSNDGWNGSWFALPALPRHSVRQSRRLHAIATTLTCSSSTDGYLYYILLGQRQLAPAAGAGVRTGKSWTALPSTWELSLVRQRSRACHTTWTCSSASVGLVRHPDRQQPVRLERTMGAGAGASFWQLPAAVARDENQLGGALLCGYPGTM